jgi:hypothetical protein
MPYTLIEIFSRVISRPHRRHHCHDPYVPARAIHTLGLVRVLLTPTARGVTMSSVTGQFTAPSLRKSGASLPLTDIDHFSLQRNGVEIATLPPSGTVISWTDTSPLTGSDTYNVLTITKDNFVSDPSNDAVVQVTQADPANAITDLTATFNA